MITESLYLSFGGVWLKLSLVFNLFAVEFLKIPYVKSNGNQEKTVKK